MNLQQRGGMLDKVRGANTSEKVVVAVKYKKDVHKNSLEWALSHVVQPGDCITLLVIAPSRSSGRKWSFPRFSGDCANGHRKSHTGASCVEKHDITDSFSQMILQLHHVFDPDKINVKIKVVSGTPYGAVAAEAKRAQANWVVLDKKLKHEEKCCMDELQCNIVVMKQSQPKVLRLNLVGSPKKESKATCDVPSGSGKASDRLSKEANSLNSTRGLVGTPTGSPELGTPFMTTDAGTSSVSSSDPGTSPFFVTESGDLKKEGSQTKLEDQELRATSSDSETDNLYSSLSIRFQPWTEELFETHRQSSKYVKESTHLFKDRIQISPSEGLLNKFSKHDREADFSGNVRDAVSLSGRVPPGPPPLCSFCRHKAPIFGKPPRWFTYAELELATGGFSQANFLAEGGFGSVHRGVLPDGQALAVKQHKLASSQGDNEFCSEVEVLSCAQHRNVVMLIGFCIENKRRLLVYEYICNGSLDSHLYGRRKEILKWSARQKIAVGAARGLRYLHEECRVGCIVHRDMRPNNILITHDFESLVGDFGLARWQPDGDTGVDTRVIGTFGYLAPEYAQSGQITEKADVYSFGVVLVELITGRKAVDLNRPKGQQCLTEWARPYLDEYAIDELIDPRLGENYSEQEVYYMIHAASLCLSRDPHIRPHMSQVLRILEGDVVMDSLSLINPRFELGNCSGRSWSDQPLLLRQSWTLEKS